MKKTRLGRGLENWFTKAGFFIWKHKPLYYILNFTWGLLANIVGSLVFLCLLPWRLASERSFLFGAVASDLTFYTHKTKEKRYYWGFSLGIFFFVCMAASNNLELKAHEVGHSCQNAILGPLDLFVVEIPSAIRYWHRLSLERRGKAIQTAYDDIWFEGSATRIGESIIHDLIAVESAVK
jgi:hypothetical protein